MKNSRISQIIVIVLLAISTIVLFFATFGSNRLRHQIWRYTTACCILFAIMIGALIYYIVMSNEKKISIIISIIAVGIELLVTFARAYYILYGKSQHVTMSNRWRAMWNNWMIPTHVVSGGVFLATAIIFLKALGADERDIITDKESGKDLDRKGYQALKNAMLRRGDTLVVKSLDRLSRNKSDIHNELQYFKDNGIRLKVIDLPTTMMDLPEGQEWVFEMVNNILIEVLGTIAEQERTTIKQRQAEGIAAAKQNGKRLGRPALTFPENWNEVYSSWKAGEITAKTAMEQTNTKRTSFYKLVNMTENN